MIIDVKTGVRSLYKPQIVLLLTISTVLSIHITYIQNLLLLGYQAS